MSPVAALLKSRTAATHEQVELDLGLLDGGLTVERLLAVIERFAGFWPGAERAVDAWASTDPDAATALDWPERRRSAILAADLVLLGRPSQEPVPTAPALFVGTPSQADVLGWLYVAEGSTLGGAVIDRALRRSAEQPMPPVSTFTPYPEGPGPKWRAYLGYLDAWAGTDLVRAHAVADAAQHCFAAPADWLAPLRIDAAA